MQTPDETLSYFINASTCERTSLEECELILYPQIVRDGKKELRELAKNYGNMNRKVLVFILSDYENRYPYYRNLIVCRTSMHASYRRSNELILPYLWECQATAFPVLSSGAKPRIGFCGQVSKERKSLVKSFERAKEIETSFIKRQLFWGGKPHDPSLVQDFHKNLAENHFTLAQRGAGNFSMRFYQALAAGRIPVLVNSDMILPFESEIPWKNIIVFEKNTISCVRKVLEIHASGQVENLQQECARLFHTWLDPRNYLIRLASTLRKMR